MYNIYTLWDHWVSCDKHQSLNWGLWDDSFNLCLSSLFICTSFSYTSLRQSLSIQVRIELSHLITILHRHRCGPLFQNCETKFTLQWWTLPCNLGKVFKDMNSQSEQKGKQKNLLFQSWIMKNILLSFFPITTCKLQMPKTYNTEAYSVSLWLCHIQWSDQAGAFTKQMLLGLCLAFHWV